MIFLLDWLDRKDAFSILLTVDDLLGFLSYGAVGEKFFLLFLTIDTAEKALDLDLTRKLHDAIDHCLGTGRASGDVDIDGNDILNSFGYMIGLTERTA